MAEPGNPLAADVQWLITGTGDIATTIHWRRPTIGEDSTQAWGLLHCFEDRNFFLEQVICQFGQLNPFL
jgi:hypothetical protein